MKTPTKKPSRIDITVALPNGKHVALEKCLVHWKWNEAGKVFLPVHTLETARRIEKAAKIGA